MKKTDFAGTPVFEIKGSDGLTRFFPYDLGTINEYIKAKQQSDEDNFCGAF